MGDLFEILAYLIVIVFGSWGFLRLVSYLWTNVTPGLGICVFMIGVTFVGILGIKALD